MIQIASHHNHNQRISAKNCVVPERNPRAAAQHYQPEKPLLLNILFHQMKTHMSEKPACAQVDCSCCLRIQSLRQGGAL